MLLAVIEGSLSFGVDHDGIRRYPTVHVAHRFFHLEATLTEFDHV